MPILILILLIIVCGVATVICAVAWGSDELEARYKVIPLITGPVCIGMIIWLIIAGSSANRIIKTEYYKIQTITQENGDKMHIIILDGNIVNVTSRFGVIPAEGKVIKRVYFDMWECGILFMETQATRPKLLIADESEMPR